MTALKTSEDLRSSTSSRCNTAALTQWPSSKRTSHGSTFAFGELLADIAQTLHAANLHSVEHSRALKGCNVRKAPRLECKCSTSRRVGSASLSYPTRHPLSCPLARPVPPSLTLMLPYHSSALASG